MFLFRHHVGAELLAEDIGEVAERVVQVFGGLLFSADGDSSLLRIPIRHSAVGVARLTLERQNHFPVATCRRFPRSVILPSWRPAGSASSGDSLRLESANLRPPAAFFAFSAATPVGFLHLGEVILICFGLRVYSTGRMAVDCRLFLSLPDFKSPTFPADLAAALSLAASSTLLGRLLLGEVLALSGKFNPRSRVVDFLVLGDVCEPRRLFGCWFCIERLLCCLASSAIVRNVEVALFPKFSWRQPLLPDIGVTASSFVDKTFKDSDIAASNRFRARSSSAPTFWLRASIT